MNDEDVDDDEDDGERRDHDDMIQLIYLMQS